MKKRGSILLLILIIMLAWWWLLRGRAAAAPEVGVLDVWATWGDEGDGLQAFFDRFSAPGNAPVRVRTRVRSDDLREALDRGETPDLIILSNADLVGSFHAEGLVAPLGRPLEAAGIDLEALYPALLAQCRTAAGEVLCLPWGGDVEALFWNKDLFARAGLDPERPPQTMEELLAYAGRLSQRNDDGDLVQVGFIPDYPRSHLELYARQLAATDRPEGAAANAQSLLAALTWQQRFYELVAPGEIDLFVSSLTPYMSSTHPVYAGTRLDCRQCHRASPIQNKKTPDTIFFEGHVALMVDGQWRAMQGGALDRTQVEVGIAPFPAPAAYPGRAQRAVTGGPVLLVPAGAADRDAVLSLLAWLMSPANLADAAHAHGFLPAGPEAARDPRFQQARALAPFLELIAAGATTGQGALPDRPAYNSALAEMEKAVLHQGAAIQPVVDEYANRPSGRR